MRIAAVRSRSLYRSAATSFCRRLPAVLFGCRPKTHGHRLRLLLAFDNHNGDDFTAVVGDLEYVRLLTEASGVVVPADKVTHVLRPLKGE